MTDATTRLNAALSGRYHVERPLGAGGMATVYLADDLRHGRKVALKVLKPELALALGAERFLAEIRTTAQLQHPHILPLFDSGEADSLLFYTMPYVEGETLGDRLARGPLPVDEAVRIAVDVAGALHVAHEQGVVHRDVKPSNILLSRGMALVADFGIARVAALTETRLTATGYSLGTVGYMSPEQSASGEEVDARADVYSLGAVLFEMLTGAPPFGRGTVLSVLGRQLAEPAPSLKAMRPDVPDGLDRAVAAALAREPADRPASAAAFAAALVAGPAAAPVAASVAAMAGYTVLVLPFVSRSPDPENEYFSDGLTEEVISDLAGISALSVISRNSAMALKGTTLDTAMLASRSGATHLVTGSVRKAGGSLRVISRRIVHALEVRLPAAERRTARDRPIEDPVAHDCYLKARQLTYSWTEEAQHHALRLVDEAIRVAGESALLLATRAQIRWNMVNSSLLPAAEGLPQAEALVERALALEPDNHVAIFVRSLIAAVRGRIETALPDLHRALHLRPGDANILLEWVRWSMSAGLENVGTYAERLLRMDPLVALTYLVHGNQLNMRGLYDQALPPLRRALELSSAPRLHGLAARSLAESGQSAEAAAILERAAAAPSNDPQRALALFLANALRGNERQALQSLLPDTIQRLQSEWDFLALANGYALLDHRAEGIASLRRATELGLLHYPFLSERSCLLTNLRDEPTFAALMDEIRPRWEAVVDWERRADA